MKTVILGGGISGISAAYHLEKLGLPSVIFEKNNSWGGLCDNFEIDGFRFDKFIHLSFSEDKYVKKLFNLATEYNSYAPKPVNFYKGEYLKHPVQNNLFPLAINEKIKIIKSFIKRSKKNIEKINNYEEWLKTQYGDYFTKKFPMIYTEKYWTVKANKLETKWVKNRMYQPTIDEVLEGAMTDKTPNTYYAKEMRYPKKGGYKSFLHKMVKGLNIKLNKEVIEIDIIDKKMIFSDGTIEKYDNLISSLPLPEICKMIINIPEKIKKSSQNLKWTSGALLSIGFNKSNIPKNLWFYIYDKEILASRIYSPSLKSKNNVPKGCSSIQAEIYFSVNNPLKKDLNTIMKEEIDKYIKMKLFKKNDIVLKDIRVEKYANVIFDKDIYENRKTIREYLKKNGIETIGKFGEWDYLWSDQCLKSGEKIALKTYKYNQRGIR